MHLNAHFLLSIALFACAHFFDSYEYKNLILTVVGIVLWRTTYKKQEILGNKLDLFSPAISFPIFYILIFGFGVLTLNLDIGYSYRAVISDRLIYFILVGFIFSLVGILFGLGITPLKKDKIFNTEIADLSAKGSQLRFWGVVVLSAGIIGFVVYYGILVGIPLLTKGDTIRHNVRPSTYGLGLIFMLLQGAGFVSIASIMLARKNKKKVSWTHYLVALFAIILTALSGYRWIVVLYILVIIVCYHYIVSRMTISLNVKKLFAISSILFVLYGFLGFVGYLRFMSNESNYLNALIAMNISTEYKYIAPAFLSFQTPIASFSYLIDKVPRVNDYFYGRYNLAQIPGASFLFMKSEKENPFVYVTDDIFGFDYRGSHGATAISLLGNFYIDGGGWVIMVGTLFIGACLSFFYRRMVNTCNLFNITVYGFYLITSLKWILVGFYIGDFRLLVMMWVAYYFIKVKNPAHRYSYPFSFQKDS